MEGTPGPHLDQNVLGQLRRGSLGLDSGSLGWPLFRRRTALSAAHHLIWRKRGTRKSGLETNAENEACSALLARLWCHLIPQTPPTARKISRVSAVPQLARLGGGWCRRGLSGLRWIPYKQGIGSLEIRKNGLPPPSYIGYTKRLYFRGSFSVMICEIASKSVHFSLRHPPSRLQLYNRSVLLGYNRFSSAIHSEALR